jgi:hypothetical protein
MKTLVIAGGAIGKIRMNPGNPQRAMGYREG